MANQTDKSFPARPAPAEPSGPRGTAPNETSEGSAELLFNSSIEHAADDLRIDMGSTISGNLIFDGDIILQGGFYGAIRCRSLLVDSGAVLEATVTARQVVIRGEASGSIDAECVRIEPTAVVDSEIRRNKVGREETTPMSAPLVADDKQATAKRNTKKKPSASESLMTRLGELSLHLPSDGPHRSPSGKKEQGH